MQIGFLHLRWYGLLFASGFLIGYFIVQAMFKKEDLPERWLDSLLIHLMLGTVLGARLGHVFFYDWSYYSKHLAEIPAVWQGGLASHGGLIGIMVALWLFSRRVAKKPMLFIIDRVAVPTALAGTLIRLGNLMNSEIVGLPTDKPWGFIFLRLDETFARHPSQLYESLAYLVIFAILMYLYWRTDARNKTGLLGGLFFALVFGARLVIEHFKENQEAFEETMALNMGQLLSIPVILVGLWLIFRALRKSPGVK